MHFSARLALFTALVVPVVGAFPSSDAAAQRPARSQVQAGTLTLVKLYPASAMVGQRFNYQSKFKENALSVMARNAPAGTSIVLAGHQLRSAQTKQVISALVPPKLISHPGKYPVNLTYKGQQSNKLIFTLLPKMRLIALHPNQIQVGERFDFQKKFKQSALWATYANVPTGASLVMDGKVLRTGQDPHKRVISALVPTYLINHPGKHVVYVRYQNAQSNKLTLRVLGAMRLLKLFPDRAHIGQHFNYQSKYKENAISALYRNAPIGTSIVWDGHLLRTGQNPKKQIISAPIPNGLLRHPRVIKVFLRFQSQRSNVLRFLLEPHA